MVHLWRHSRQRRCVGSMQALPALQISRLGCGSRLTRALQNCRTLLRLLRSSWCTLSQGCAWLSSDGLWLLLGWALPISCTTGATACETGGVAWKEEGITPALHQESGRALHLSCCLAPGFRAAC